MPNKVQHFAKLDKHYFYLKVLFKLFSQYYDHLENISALE